MQSEYDIRVGKLARIAELGWQAYPSTAEHSHTVSAFLEQFEVIEQGQTPVSLAGRLMSIRTQGGVTFATVRDQSGSVQLFIKKEIVGDEAYDQFLELIDRADFVSVKGVAMVTKRGEKSLQVQTYTLITKALLPLPEKWHGLADTEIRYRQRYLDLIANDEVNKRFMIRSKLVQYVREFLYNEGYVEVETPVLQPLYGGTSARPFVTHHHTLDLDLYLRISTELYLKRLVVGGMERVFEISRIFRNEGVSYKHNPEFTMLETMCAYEDYTYNMSLIERAYEFCAQKLFGTTQLPHGEHLIEVKAPWRRVRMVDAVREATGWDYHAWTQGTLAQAKKAALECKPSEPHLVESALSIGELLTVLFEDRVEHTLIQPTIVYDYPVETSPLAKQSAADPRFVERFEHYVLGQEQGNNYSELNDPLELRKRFEAEANKEKEGKGIEDVQKTDDDFIEAMAHGMPPTSGAAIGIDRMAMLFTGAASIKEVILFPTMRPRA